MFSGVAMGRMDQRIEQGRSSLENTGNRLESEFFGEVDGTKYKELAYKFLHKEGKPERELSPEDRYAKMLSIKEAAQKEFEDTLDLADRSKYINFADSLKLVEKCQVGNPEKPNKFFSRALYENIKNRFAEKYDLKFFTATGGTHLDVVHGVDCFFKLYDKEGNELAFATIDLTKNRAKDNARADVLIHVDDDDLKKYDPSQNNKDYDKEFFNQKIEGFSENIIDALVENYKKKINN